MIVSGSVSGWYTAALFTHHMVEKTARKWQVLQERSTSLLGFLENVT